MINFVDAPWLALIPALIFGVLYTRAHRRLTLIAAVTWLAYFAYEEAMRQRILCSGECNIRIDLLLLYPLLLAVSLAGVVSALRRSR